MLLIARVLLRIVTRPFERLSEIDPFEVNGDEMTALLGAVHDVASCWPIGAGLIISRALDAPGDPVEAALIFAAVLKEVINVDCRAFFPPSAWHVALTQAVARLAQYRLEPPPKIRMFPDKLFVIEGRGHITRPGDCAHV